MTNPRLLPGSYPTELTFGRTRFSSEREGSARTGHVFSPWAPGVAHQVDANLQEYFLEGRKINKNENMKIYRKKILN